MTIRLPYFLGAILFAIVSCTPAPKPEISTGHLGEIYLQVTGKAEALPHFENGILLLHNFEYQDAREAFLEAQKLDPNMAMAYWGEAMTYNHPLWRSQDYEGGITALEKLDISAEDRIEKASSELEKDLIRAINILYGAGEKYDRDLAYSTFLARLYEKYPDSNEVAAFYALSLLGAVPVGRNEAAYEKGAKIARGILEENPRHPGALHYLIHANDDPAHAALALEAAQNYSKVAPDAAHALHMPSHIFVALGMWDEVIASNIAAYGASVKRMEEKGLDAKARNFHSFHWLAYGYLQKGEFAKAREMVLEMQQFAAEAGNVSARSYLIEMKASYLLHTEEWDGEVAAIPIEPQNDLNIVSRAQDHYIEGRKALAKGDLEKTAEILRAMAADRDASSRQVSDEGLSMCSVAGANSSVPNQLDIDYSYTMEMELLALLAQANKDTKTAEKWLIEATTLEDNTSYSFGPPTVVQPSHELYATWLMEQGREQEARKQLERALERGPKRWLAKLP